MVSHSTAHIANKQQLGDGTTMNTPIPSSSSRAAPCPILEPPAGQHRGPDGHGQWRSGPPTSRLADFGVLNLQHDLEAKGTARRWLRHLKKFSTPIRPGWCARPENATAATRR
jgi:hypothetical protein